MKRFSRMDELYGLLWAMRLEGLVDDSVSADDMVLVVDKLLTKYDVLREGGM